MFKLKRNVEDIVARYKVKWVMKSYLQQYEVDFDQIFASMIKSMIFRVLFAIAIFLNLKIEQMNMKIVFLYDLIDVKMYVKYSQECENDDDICKLKKALYDLKQSSRLWYDRLFIYFWKSFNYINWMQIIIYSWSKTISKTLS